MKPIRFIRNMLFTLCFSFSASATSPVYTVMTEDFNPFGFYQEDGQLTGVAVEITRLLLKEIKHPDNIRVLPWARALRNIETQSNQVLFAMARTAEREDKFQWVGPILSDNIYLFQKADNPIFYKHLQQARKVEYIAVSRGFPEQSFLEEIDFYNLVLTHNPESNIKLLLSNRVDLIAAGANVIDDMVKEAGFSANQIKQTGIKLFGTDLYIALSKNIPLEQVIIWQNALDKLKKQPEYNTIINSYHFN